MYVAIYIAIAADINYVQSLISRTVNRDADYVCCFFLPCWLNAQTSQLYALWSRKGLYPRASCCIV
jgi:hypothetical protein